MTGSIDYDHLALYTGGDESLEAEVFSLFVDQIDVWMRLLRIDAKDEDWSAAAHSLKGSARGVGAVTLADACAKAEGLVGELSVPVKREAVLERIRVEIDAVKEEIAQRDYRRTFSELRSAS